MSINAINSVSMYEYYYSIEKNDKKKKSSAIDKQMKELNLTPTDNEALNISLIKKAKINQKAEETKEEDKTKRPWKDLMYQLNLDFNDNPIDDIKDIKKELKELIIGIEDEELNKEVSDLENYVENLYLSYSKNSLNSLNNLGSFTIELNNLALINKVNFL